MNIFFEYQEFLIKIIYSNNSEDMLYKKIFIDEDIDEAVNLFIDKKINELEDNFLKLALILKKYDISDKSKKINRGC